MSYYGDFPLSGTVNIGFTTVDSTGAATALSSATVGVFRGNGTTRYTVGVTGTASFNSQTGHNLWTVSLSDTTVYLAANNYTVVMSAGSVGAVNVAGYQLGSFSIQNRNFAVNVTSIGSQTASASGTITFPAATLASTTNITAGVITTVGTLTTYTGNTVQTGDSFARIGVAGAGLTNIDLPNQTMDITGNLSGSVGSVTGAVGSVTSIGSSGIGAASLSTEAVDKITDLGLGRDWTLVTTTIGARSTLNALRRSRNKVAVVSSVGTVYKEDDTAAAWTMAVSTIAAQAISAVDPA